MDFFRQLLDIYPGKKQLENDFPEELLVLYDCINYTKIAKRVLAKKQKMYLGNTEEKWYQFISFCTIASVYLRQEKYVGDFPGTECLSQTSKEKGKRIIEDFNKQLGTKYNDFSEFTIAQLCEIAKSKKTLI